MDDGRVDLHGQVLALDVRHERQDIVVQQVKAKLQVLGLEAIPSSPDTMTSYAAKEREKWAPVIKAAGIKVD